MLRSLGLMVGLLFVFGYFSYHLMNGPRSIFKQAQIAQNQSRLHADLDQVRAENKALRNKIAGLHPDTLDDDLLIERLHAVSLTLPGEVLLYLKE